MECSLNKETNRYNYIDMAKGIIILLVMYYHIGIYYPIEQYIDSIIMPFFFFVSGVLAYKNKSDKSIKDYIKDKTKKLLYCFCIFYIPLMIVESYYYYTIDFFSPIIIILLSINGPLVLWFIPVLYFSSILFFIINKKQDRINKIIKVIILIICIVVSCIFIQYLNTYKINIYEFNIESFALFPIRILFSYTLMELGYLIEKYILSKIKLLYKSLSLLILIPIYIYISKDNYMFYMNLGMHSVFITYISSIVGSIALLNLCELITKFILVKFLSFIGKNSFTAMIYHMIFCIDIFYEPFIYIANNNVYLGKFIYFIVCIPLLYFLIKLVNKYLLFTVKHPKINNKNI